MSNFTRPSDAVLSETNTCALVDQIFTIALTSIVLLSMFQPFRKPYGPTMQIALFAMFCRLTAHIYINSLPDRAADLNFIGRQYIIGVSPVVAAMLVSLLSCLKELLIFAVSGGAVALVVRSLSLAITLPVAIGAGVATLALMWVLTSSKPARATESMFAAVTFTIASTVTVALGVAELITYYKYQQPLDDIRPCFTNMNLMIVCEPWCGSVTTDSRHLYRALWPSAVVVAGAARLVLVLLYGWEDIDAYKRRSERSPDVEMQELPQKASKGPFTQIDKPTARPLSRFAGESSVEFGAPVE